MNTAQNYRAGNSHANTPGLTAQNAPSAGHLADKRTALPLSVDLQLSLLAPCGQLSEVEMIYWAIDSKRDELLNKVKNGDGCVHSDEYKQVERLQQLQNDLFMVACDHLVKLVSKEVSRG